MLRRAALLAALLPVLACSASGDSGDEGDDDAAALQVGGGAWDAQAEAEYGAFIARIGEARAAGKCTTLNACVDDPAINPYRAPTDAKLDLFADCADVPMELRAYFATKTRRAFKFVSAVASDHDIPGQPPPEGEDLRYTSGNHPIAWSTAAGSKTMQRFMSKVSASVHSGFFRMAPEVEDSDTYPIKPSRASLRPGTVYYDPNGHVLVVYRVDADGTIWTFDGHPDNSLTFGRFTEGAYALGGRAQGGGFRNFRPTRVEAGTLVSLTNAELSDYGDNQYGHGTGYFDWIRVSLGGTPSPPEEKLGALLDQLCLDLGARATAVDAAHALSEGPLGPIPPNIYGATGDWEAFSTPAATRDFAELPQRTSARAESARRRVTEREACRRARPRQSVAEASELTRVRHSLHERRRRRGSPHARRRSGAHLRPVLRPVPLRGDALGRGGRDRRSRDLPDPRRRAPRPLRRRAAQPQRDRPEPGRHHRARLRP
ncbi:MAG: hypothetical protein U0235_11125 [Polyangiaceae bacterium]